MRPIERIRHFCEIINWKDLANRWDLPNYSILYTWDTLNGDITSENCPEFAHMFEYWHAAPDQRIGQVLINTGIITKSCDLKIWNDEESDILLDQGIAPEDCLYWTSIYDKEGNLLDKPVSKLLKDLDTDHIVNIYKHVYIENNKTLSDTYDLAFNNVLTKRKAYKELEEIQLIYITHVNAINKKD